MSAIKKTCRRTSRAQKTVTVAAWEEGQEKPVDVLTLRRAVGIETRDTINQYLKLLDLYGLNSLRWEDAKHIIGMFHWARIRPGNRRFSKQNYVALMQQNLAERALQKYGQIDLETKLEEVKNYVRHNQSRPAN